VACLSPYHFHRVYRAMRGETTADTVRRLRLHRAAVDLIAGELPVARVARRAGYGSQEAFTRAFKAAYGVPPARYRASFVPARNGTRAELDRPYKWLYGTWLAQSGEEPDNAPTVEEYLNDARSVPPTELRTLIWLPLR